jgi:hypothetical protein
VKKDVRGRSEAGVNAVECIRIPSPAGNVTPAVLPTAYRYTDEASTTLEAFKVFLYLGFGFVSGDRLPVGFDTTSKYVGSVTNRAALQQVFSKYFGFPCHSFIPIFFPYSLPSLIQGWCNTPISGLSISGLDPTLAT